jgi:hypothetical protein
MLFVLDQIRSDLASWKPHDEVVAKTEQLVVPSFAGLDEGQQCQVFVLLTQEGSHEACVDRYLRVGHSQKGHCRANVIMPRLHAASLRVTVSCPLWASVACNPCCFGMPDSA